MPVYQFDVENWIPWSGSPDGRYYWTNVYYKVCPNDAAAITASFAISVFSHYPQRQSVRAHWQRITSPPGSGLIVSEGTMFDERGAWGGLDDAPLLHTCVRVNGYIGGKVRFYKRFRLPLMPDEIIDGMLSSAVLGYFQSTVLLRLAELELSTAGGDAIESFDVNPRALGWQLRHGTKRRERTVIA